MNEQIGTNNEFEMLRNNSLEIDIQSFFDHMMIYNSGIKEVRTKLEILDDEFQTKYSYNPIHHIESRLKSVKSIIKKIKEKGLEVTLENIKENVTDIAGIRVICNYLNDIYEVEKLLVKQNDVKLLRRRDYIKTPKQSGYQSLHLLIEVPIFLSDGPKPIPVEVQIRTIAMDFWASLEHRLKYKSDNDVAEDLRYRLKICAKAIQELDLEMQSINKVIAHRQEETDCCENDQPDSCLTAP
ncbi:MAG: GTP pyrophosphokinase family protein [Ruminococcus sp.]|nr:GTP pyrophosphokinase family protein [Ruminococcus sp.]